MPEASILRPDVPFHRFENDTRHMISGRKPLVIWYGDKEPETPPYLVEGLLPQRQTALIAGQHSAGKTFVADDLSVAVMLGQPFAGHVIKRPGAVLWLAAEGASEVDIRIKAAVLHRTGSDYRGLLPFCRQAGNVPKLTDAGAFEALMAIITETLEGLAHRFMSVPLVLIVIDTMNSAAAFQDQNAGGEAQKVMDMLRALSDATGALVLAIDHFGKLAETGVKGSQNKSDSADTILALSVDRDRDGNVSARRMRVHKQRSGREGETIPFRLVEAAVDDHGGTSCAIEWSTSAPAEIVPPKAKDPWPGKAKFLHRAITTALIEHGEARRPFGIEGPELRTVAADRVRQEFYAAVPDNGDKKTKQDSKRKLFTRLVEQAVLSETIGSREISGSTLLWLIDKAQSNHARFGSGHPDTEPDMDTPII